MVGKMDIPPSEYWQMTPSEIAIIFEAKRPKQMGGLHEDDFYMLEAKRKELEKQGVKLL